MKRRTFFLGMAAATLAAGFRTSGAATLPQVTVYKSPTCGCCGGWVEHMRANGFDVKVIEVADVTPYRQRLGVPEVLGSCHTAAVAGYAIEGHVPADDVLRLLRERPEGQGLAVPAMVPGSPGMGGVPVAYETLLFEKSGSFRVFQRH